MTHYVSLGSQKNNQMFNMPTQRSVALVFLEVGVRNWNGLRPTRKKMHCMRLLVKAKGHDNAEIAKVGCGIKWLWALGCRHTI